MAYINKRSRKNKSGKTVHIYRVRYADFSGVMRERNFSRLSEAKRFAESLTEVKLGEISGPAEMIRFLDLGRAYMRACKNGRDGRMPVAASTYKTNHGYLENHVVPVMGDLRLTQLTPALMNRFAQDFIQRTTSRQTAKHLLTLTKAILQYGTRHGYLTKNPAEGIVISVDTRTSKEVKIKSFTNQEAKALLITAKRLRDSPNGQISLAWRRYYPFVVLLLHTGLRASEILALKKDDFDHNSNTVTISRALSQSGEIGRLKSAYAERTIPVAPRVLMEIDDLTQTTDGEFLFCTRSGRPMSYHNTLKNMWKRLITEAGVRPLGMHAARHYFASTLIRNHATLLEIKKYMGHHSAGFTYDQYGHLIDASEARASDIADRIAIDADDDE